MAHAGTIDLSGSTLDNKANRWPAALLGAVLIGAMIAGIWLAQSTGIAGAKTGDRSFDGIEGQRGAVTLSTGGVVASDQDLDRILAGAHAAPYVVKRDRVGGQ